VAITGFGSGDIGVDGDQIWIAGGLISPGSRKNGSMRPALGISPGPLLINVPLSEDRSDGTRPGFISLSISKNEDTPKGTFSNFLLPLKSEDPVLDIVWHNDCY
jgi:hypothetical protein